jgi:hypothetical protein
VFGESYHPEFSYIRRKNDILFSSRDTSEVRAVIDEFGIDYLVCEPNTDLSIESELPHWLALVSGSGAQRIYKVLSPPFWREKA